MLNRRTLRIKVMQSLFAFEQCREANLMLSKDELAERFAPDLNSMETQDKVVLKKQKELALNLFDKKFADPALTLPDEEKIVKAIEKGLADFHSRVKKDFDFLKKSTLLDIERLSSTYHLMLNLLPALAQVAATDKKNSFRNFTENPFVRAISQSAELKTESAKSGGHWETRMDKVRSWFKEIVKIDEEFLAFSGLKSLTQEQELEIIKHLLRRLIISQTAIAGFFEDEDQRWAEDKEVLKSMVEKSLKAIKTNGILELQKLSMEWEEDKEFVDVLFQKSAWLPAKHQALIGSHTVNWDVDRLPLTDRVVLQMAIAELTQFPNIPVKVTINEYIELTKGYSTPKSKQFINGILDVISKELKTSGEMKKSGRGLIDNK
jgi:N utilization substance protein B